MDRLSANEYYLKVVEILAQRSTCARRSVGAIITDNRGIVLGTGYNGVPSGWDHCTSTPCAGINDKPGDTSRCMAIHAEINALIHCSDLRHAHTIYVSCTPCFECAKVIANTGIKHVICADAYADQRGYDILVKAGKNVVILYPKISTK